MTTPRLSAVAALTGPSTSPDDPLAAIRRPDGTLPLFLRTTQAAALMDVEIRTIRKGIDAGTVPAIRIGSAIRIPVAPFLTLCGLSMAEVSIG